MDLVVYAVPFFIVAMLAELASMALEQPLPRPAGSSTGLFDVDAWLQAHNLQAKRSRWNGGWRWKLDDCPFSDAHSDGAYVVQLANGAISAGSRCPGDVARRLTGTLRVSSSRIAW